jgi:hypothetical protein
MTCLLLSHTASPPTAPSEVSRLVNSIRLPWGLSLSGFVLPRSAPNAQAVGESGSFGDRLLNLEILITYFLSTDLPYFEVE